MKRNKTIQTSLIALGISIFATSAHAVAVFTFIDATDFDGGQTGVNAGVGTSMTESDGGTSVTITTVDIGWREYVESSPGVWTAGALRTASSTGIGETNIAGSTNALGINNPSIGNTDWDTIGDGTESSDMNFEESWTIVFNVDVTIDLLDMESMAGPDTITISVDDGVTADVELGNSGTPDSHADPLSGLVIAAGTEVTFTTGGDLTTDIRMESLEITAVVPEPSSAALLGLGGLVLIMRRRK